MSPENSPNRPHESVAKLTKGLKSRYETCRLPTESVFGIPTLEKYQEMARCEDNNEGVIQYLRAVIRNDDDFYSIVDVVAAKEHITPDGKAWRFQEGTAITRHKPHEQAELLDFIKKTDKPDEYLTIKEAFNIAQKKNGSVGIENLNPKKKMKVFTPVNPTGSKVKSGKSFLLRPKDPTENTAFWSVNPGIIKQKLSNFIDKK